MTASIYIEDNQIKITKDLGGARVIYSFFSMSGDEHPQGEPFVDSISIYRASKRRNKQPAAAP